MGDITINQLKTMFKKKINEPIYINLCANARAKSATIIEYEASDRFSVILDLDDKGHVLGIEII